MSVLHRFTTFDYPFGILKHFFKTNAYLAFAEYQAHFACIFQLKATPKAKKCKICSMLAVARQCYAALSVISFNLYCTA